MNIDKVYLINLDDSKDRFISSDNQFKKLGGIFANYKKISAINGKKLSDNYVRSITTPYSYYYLKNNRDLHYQIDKIGAIGCSLSHIKAWKDMIDNNYQNVIIFEDDFFINDIKLFYEQIYNLPNDLQIAKLHYILQYKDTIIPVNKYWDTNKNLYIFSGLCYVLNINLTKKLYKQVLPIDTHIDFYMNYYCLSNDIPIYYAKNQSVSSNNFDSIIGHSLYQDKRIYINHILINNEIKSNYFIILICIIVLFLLIIYYIKK